MKGLVVRLHVALERKDLVGRGGEGGVGLLVLLREALLAVLQVDEDGRGLLRQLLDGRVAVELLQRGLRHIRRERVDEVALGVLALVLEPAEAVLRGFALQCCIVQQPLQLLVLVVHLAGFNLGSTKVPMSNAVI